MKVSYQWLQDWAPNSLSAQQAGDLLTLAGLELDGLEAAGPSLEGVLVGRIQSAEKHPDADRLQVCTVDVGQEEVLQIVCGAPNARAGLTVAVATVGTRLPGDFKIKKSKIRGVASFGMLCSGGELGMDDTPGIVELPDDLPLGQALADALGLNDQVLEIALTPNRGDCFSVRGIARELACVNRSEFTAPFSGESCPVSIDTRLPIEIESTQDCSRYAGRAITGLDRSVPTPLWMSERLRRAGIRSINPLVDVTNYVMLELGQPMHAFDLGKLDQGIQVRRARAGESLTLLNEQDITLGADDLLIADAKGPLALAGAMGGLASSVDEQTQDVFLESACFSPAAVAGTGRRHKVSSDSLQRFERGVDPQLQVAALERATQLLLSIAGGKAGPICETQAGEWRAPRIALSPARVQQLLGSNIEASAMADILRRLDCEVSDNGDGFEVCPPSHRYDLNESIDLVEEIARIHGYDNLPGRDRKVAVSLSAPAAQSDDDRLRAALVERGYFEAFSFSFADAKTDDALAGPEAPQAIALDNPMAKWMSHMRRSLWASLLPVWKHNVQRQQDRIRLFEIGRQYGKNDGEIQEVPMVAGIVSGLAAPEQWGQAKRMVDFFDLKADIQSLLGPLRDQVEWNKDQQHPALHPGRSAGLCLNGRCYGHVGQLHPALLKTLDLPQAPLVFALELDLWTQTAALELQELASAPSSRRDLALVVNQELEAQHLMQFVKSHAGPSLREVRVFDVFSGDALPKGFKSIALGLIFQDFSRTLTDQEIDSTVATLVEGLKQDCGAQIRD